MLPAFGRSGDCDFEVDLILLKRRSKTSALFRSWAVEGAHGNGYADPNVLIANTIASVSTDGDAFNVREGNHAVDLGVSYGFVDRLAPFTQLQPINTMTIS